MQTSVNGYEEERCYSYPFGDGLNCTGADATEHHFTGKERDSESGLDYFGARYQSSNLGRFLTPDWAGAPTDVPYASYGDPQSLKLMKPLRSAVEPQHARIPYYPGRSWQTSCRRSPGHPPNKPGDDPVQRLRRMQQSQANLPDSLVIHADSVRRNRLSSPKLRNRTSALSPTIRRAELFLRSFRIHV
jgi:RHS repeat-associated protein